MILSLNVGIVLKHESQLLIQNFQIPLHQCNEHGNVGVFYALVVNFEETLLQIFGTGRQRGKKAADSINAPIFQMSKTSHRSN